MSVDDWVRDSRRNGRPWLDYSGGSASWSQVKRRRKQSPTTELPAMPTNATLSPRPLSHNPVPVNEL
jgi:hypothetical protein